MYQILKKYGNIIEITKYEKKSHTKTVRLFTPRRKGLIIKGRRSDSLRRTKSLCVRKLLCAINELGSPLLITLTFQGSASDAQYASDSLRLFLRRLRGKYPGTHALFVPEISPKGRIHFHGLLFGLSQDLGDKVIRGQSTIYGLERQSRVLASLWKVGFLDCRQTDGSPRLGYYLGKYITKAHSSTLINGLRIIRSTKGFPSEIVVKDNDYIIDRVVARFKDIKPMSEWQGYTPFTGNISKTKYEDR